jgi:hypothetical protein
MDPLLNADSNDWLLSWCESFGHTIPLLRCRLRAFYLGPQILQILLPRLWRLGTKDVPSNGEDNL